MKRLMFFSVLCLAIWAVPVVAQSTPQGPAVQQNGFSRSLAVHEGEIFAGEPNNAHSPGRVYVFERSGDTTWTDRTALEADDGTVDDSFGSTLDVAGSTLVVGAPAVNAAYVFQSQNGNWTQVARLSPSDSSSGFGTSVAVANDRLYVTATDAEVDGESVGGAVYVFQREGDGQWTETTTLTSKEVSADAQFGSTLAATDGRLLVGAPRHEGGAVVAFRREGTQWTEEQTLQPAGLGEGARFGVGLHVQDDQVLVGAPRAYEATGVVYAYAFDDSDQTWKQEGRLLPFDGQSRHLFGAALAFDGVSLWIGAPGADDRTGALYQYEQRDGVWTAAARVQYPDAEPGNMLGTTLAAQDSVVAAGLPGDDYGAGTMAVYMQSDQEWTATSPLAPGSGEVLSSLTGEMRPCEDGDVEAFDCKGLDLQAFLPIKEIGGDRGIQLNDIWGWTDPQTGTEYALVGRMDGTSFVDVSDPSNPVYVGELPLTDGARPNSWRDIKVYDNHAFVVADNAGDHGMQIFDLTQLRDVEADSMPVTFEETAHYDRVNSAHNVVINTETGFAYIVGSSGGGETCGGGLHMVNIQNPTQPSFAGCFADPTTGRSGTGYTHDAQCVIYQGPDQDYQGQEICFGANETDLSIADVTDKDNPVAVATASYPDHAYVHQGWLTEDHRYFYQNDELDEIQNKVDSTRTLVWDVSDLDNPTLVNEVLLSEPATDHNLYVKGETMYQSNYVSGLRILDISDPTNPEEVGYFDTQPFGDNDPGFGGTWSNYPYFESGTIIVSSMGEGLFVLERSKQEL